MISELIIHKMGWTVVWYAHPGGSYLRNLTGRWGGRWHVGVDTGPQHDLICLKHCRTNKEAERWLSPGGSLISIAVIKAILKLIRLRLEDRVVV